MAFEKLETPTVRESFVRELENKIISGELKVGDKLPAAKDLRELCDLVTGYYHRLTVMSGNSFMAMLYNSTKEPQACVYHMCFEKNGTDTTIATCKMLHRLLKDRDSASAKKLMLEALNTALSGPMAVVQTDEPSCNNYPMVGPE